MAQSTRILIPRNGIFVNGYGGIISTTSPFVFDSEGYVRYDFQSGSRSMVAAADEEGEGIANTNTTEAHTHHITEDSQQQWPQHYRRGFTAAYTNWMFESNNLHFLNPYNGRIFGSPTAHSEIESAMDLVINGGIAAGENSALIVEGNTVRMHSAATTGSLMGVHVSKTAIAVNGSTISINANDITLLIDNMDAALTNCTFVMPSVTEGVTFRDGQIFDGFGPRGLSSKSFSVASAKANKRAEEKQRKTKSQNAQAKTEKGPLAARRLNGASAANSVAIRPDSIDKDLQRLLALVPDLCGVFAKALEWLSLAIRCGSTRCMP